MVKAITTNAAVAVQSIADKYEGVGINKTRATVALQARAGEK